MVSRQGRGVVTQYLIMDDKIIQHVASLARINLTEKERVKMKSELSAILKYVEQLNTVNTEGIEPLYQTTGLINSMRSDEHRGDFKMDEKLNAGLINQAPEKENRFIKVKSILNK